MHKYKYLINFVIGSFAGLCAVFVPRIVSMLGGNAEIQHFHINFVTLGIVFALIIGGVTAIFVQSKQKSPPEIFMTALGIPALLAGALNSGAASNEMQKMEGDKQKLIESVSRQNGISIDESAAPLVPLQPVPEDKHSPSSRFDFSLIPSAYAQEAVPTMADNGGLNLGIQVEQKSYVIVLERSGNRESAMRRADELRRTIPTATVVQSKDDYLVVESTAPRNKADALLRAVELKNHGNLNLYLLQVK